MGVNVMIKRSLIVSLLILLLIGHSTVFASAPKLGTAGASELLIPMGARNVAMAGANIASVAGTEAIYWNPAGLSAINSGDVTFSYMDYFADMKVSYLAAGVNVGTIGVLGVSFQIMDIGDIKVTTIEAPEGTGELLSPDYITAGLTFSKRFTDRILFGTSAKLISEKIGDMAATATAFDFGLQYVTPFGFNFGVTMKNIGSTIQFDGNSAEFNADIPWANPNATTRKAKLDLAEHELPASMNMGVAYKMDLAGLGALTFSGVYNNNSYELNHVKFGTQFSLKDFLFLRAGYASYLYPDDYEWDEEQQFGLTMGFGLNLNLSGTMMRFDYANRPTELFDATQYFSVSFGF